MAFLQFCMSKQSVTLVSLWIPLSFQETASPCRPRGLTFSWWGRHGLCPRYKPTELAPSFFCSVLVLLFFLFFCCCCCCYFVVVVFCFFFFSVFTALSTVSFHNFSRQLSAFSLSSSGLISVLLVLSAIYLFMKGSLSPDVSLCG